MRTRLHVAVVLLLFVVRRQALASEGELTHLAHQGASHNHRQEQALESAQADTPPQQQQEAAWSVGPADLLVVFGTTLAGNHSELVKATRFWRKVQRADCFPQSASLLSCKACRARSFEHSIKKARCPAETFPQRLLQPLLPSSKQSQQTLRVLSRHSGYGMVVVWNIIQLFVKEVSLLTAQYQAVRRASVLTRDFDSALPGVPNSYLWLRLSPVLPASSQVVRLVRIPRQTEHSCSYRNHGIPLFATVCCLAGRAQPKKSQYLFQQLQKLVDVLCPESLWSSTPGKRLIHMLPHIENASCILAHAQSSLCLLQGVAAFIATNENVTDAELRARSHHNEVLIHFPDNSDGRTQYPGDTRAALAPLLAHRALRGQYKWMLYGDDDTLWFINGVVELARKMDPDLPYIVTGGGLMLCQPAL